MEKTATMLHDPWPRISSQILQACFPRKDENGAVVDRGRKYGVCIIQARKWEWDGREKPFASNGDHFVREIFIESDIPSCWLVRYPFTRRSIPLEITGIRLPAAFVSRQHERNDNEARSFFARDRAGFGRYPRYQNGRRSSSLFLSAGYFLGHDSLRPDQTFTLQRNMPLPLCTSIIPENWIKQVYHRTFYGDSLLYRDPL